MINLIPNQEKKIMIRDFYSRLVATIFTMLSFCILIGATAVFPSYFSSILKKNLANEKLKNQAQEPLPEVDQSTMSLIDDLNLKLGIIQSAEQQKFSVAEKIIKEIISKKLSDIKINKISYENNPIRGKIVNLNGTAPSREKLLLFREALETNPNFSNVDLPISNFIKGSNIEFHLSLIHL